MNSLTRLLICVVWVPLVLPGPLAGAPDARPAGDSAAAPEDAPLEVLAHSPIMDGIIESDQWTVVRTFPAGDARASLAAAWDSGQMYLALDSPEAAAAVFYVDAKADGWLNGADNYEIRVAAGETGPRVTVQQYNSFQNSPTLALSPVVLDAKAAVKTVGSRTVFELEVPFAESKGLVYRDGRVLAVGAGVSLASDPSKTAPGDPRAGLQAIVLKDEVAPAVVEGLKLDIRVKDRRLVPGQTLSLDLLAQNTGVEPLAYSSFSIGGEPRVADLLNFLRVRGGTLQPSKGIKWGFSSDLPETMPLGTFAVIAELRLEDGRTARILSSFDVLEPVDAALDPGSGPVGPGAERKIIVTIRNNCNRPINGTVRLSLPEALMPGIARDTQKFLIRSENNSARVEFRLKRPDGTAGGEYPVSAEVQMGDFSRALNGAILLGPAQ